MSFPKMSLNRLLMVNLVIGVPATLFVSLVLNAPGPALLILPLGWVLLRELNKRAWRRHFRPKDAA